MEKEDERFDGVNFAAQLNPEIANMLQQEASQAALNGYGSMGGGNGLSHHNGAAMMNMSMGAAAAGMLPQHYYRMAAAAAAAAQQQQQQQQHMGAVHHPMGVAGGDLGLDEEPMYVNAKQYHRILKRRQARARFENQLKIQREKVCVLYFLYGLLVQ